MTKQQARDKAVSRFLNGYNCAESLSLTLMEHLGLECKLIPKLATGFGGGFGRRSSVCGAVTGAIIGISMKLGIDEERDSKEPAYAAALQFAREFEKGFGTLLCGELTGCDLSTPEGREKFQMEEIKAKKCGEFVGRAVEIAYEILQDAAPSG